MGSVVARLAEHLEDHYDIRVSSLTPLEPWAPDGVQRVDRAAGPSWVARVFPEERPVEQAEGDAEILRFLDLHGFPAERCACPAAVSMLDDHAVLVTECVPGVNARGDTTTATARTIGELAGRLYALPPGAGAVGRPAGGWHHLSVRGGGRRDDVDTLAPLMDLAAGRVPRDERHLYDALRAELDRVDYCEDLPHALINIDLGGPNVMLTSAGEATVVDWTGAGRGPRLLSLSAMLVDDPQLVDAFVDGYVRHGRLEDDELARLADALLVHSLILDCWTFVFRSAPLGPLVAGRAALRQLADAVADRARQAFRDNARP